MKKTTGFNLFWVIIIIIISAIVSSISTGVVMLNSSSTIISDSIYNINQDKELKEFIEVYQTLTSKYYDKIDKSGMLNAAEEAMTKYLGDKYTTYLNDSEYQEIIDELSGDYNRIGLTIEGSKVLKVASLSSAYKAGIRTGDVLLKIDSVNVENMTGNEIASLIKSIKGKNISIEVLRNGEVIVLSLTKDNYPSITYQKIYNSSIGYIYIKNFSQNLSDQVSHALKELEKDGISSLIIDVRDNSGGYLSAAEEVSSIFLEKGKIIYSLEANDKKYPNYDVTNEKRTYPMAVLINSNSASASEILAAALNESYGAKLVGTKSYGKGKVQQVVNLNSGDSVKYTAAKWLTPFGVCIDGYGLNPNEVVTYQETDTYDTQLLKAIELLQ